MTGKTLTLTGEGVWENEAYEGGRGTETWNAVAASGTMTNSGLLTVGSDAQAGTFTALGGTVSNQGEMNLTHVETALYSGAAVTNGAPEAKTDAVKALYNNLTITAGSSVNHAYEKGHILTVKDGGTWTNNHIAIWDQVGVENDKAQNNGTLTLAKTDAENALVIGKTGVLTGNGSISGEGVKVLVEGALAQNQVTVGTLANKAGTIALGTLTNFGTDNTYVHDGASGKVSAADDSVFSGTNLVFTGGGDIHIDATTVGGAADFGGLRDGSGLGANNVVIKGGSNYVLGTQVGDSANTAAYNGMTTVYVKTLKDETTLDIQEGGRLVTEGLALTGTQKSTKLNGGVLTTGLASLFSTIANKYISLDATDPESGKVDVNSHILTVDSIGSIKSIVAAGIDFVKGAIGFNDSAVSLSVVNSVADAIRTAAGASASDIDVVFDGRITNSAGVVGSLTYTDLEDLFTEQGEIPGSPVTSPGIIIGGLDLDASGDADGIVSFGAPDSSSDVKGPVGFKKVTGAEGVNAIDGRGALLGNELAGAIGSAPFNWTDDNRLIETGTAGKGGTVEVGANGRFDFGSKGTEKPHTGWVDSVNAAGTFKVQNGEYGVKGDLVSSGTTVVDTDALLHTGGITAEKGADAAVRGTIILDAADGSQKITSEAGSVITVSTSTGRLDANGKDASLAGTVHTQEGGTSLWHDMTVAVGGLNHVGNGGTETGRYLTIEEGAQNAWVVDAGGKSTWDKVTNASGSNAGETIVGTGTKTEGELADKSASEFNVAVGGSYENTGRLDLTKAGNTVSDGAISTGSKGETLYDDLTVGANGSDTVKAGGSEKGDILDLTDASQKGWVVEAGGNSVWNEVIGAKGENSGTVTVGTGEKKDGELADTADSQFNVAADDAYTNNGTTDLTKAGNVSVDGRLDTGAAGETKFDDKTIGETGSSTVAGKESGDILDLTHGGREVVEETGSITWNQILVGGNDAENPGSGILDNKGTTQVGKLVVEAGGQIRNDGKLTGDELTVGKGGVIEMTGGESDFKKTVAESGSVIVIGNGKDLSPDNKVAVNLDFGSADNPVNGSIFVIGNGELNLGSDLGFDDAIKAPQLPDSASKLIVGKTVHVGNTGSLIVGKDTWTSSTDDAAGKANVAHGNGNLIFAKDSFTVIDVPGVGHGPAFKTESSGKTVTVEDGATLILGNVTESGDYVITDGFAVGSGPAGWLDEDHLYALSDGTGLDWILSLKTNPNQIIVNAAYSDIRTLYPDIVIPDTVNDALKHSGDDARGAADTVLTEILKDKDGTVSGKTRTVNTLAQIAQAGGVFANNQDAMTSALNAVESRTSFTGDVFNASGVMAGSEKPTDLWAQLLTSTRTADNQKSAGRMTGGYDADVTGVMAGLDHRIDGTQWRAGAALSYQKADIDSTGDWDAVSTDAETFGVQAYAHFSPSGYFNLIGSVGYFHSSSDVDMNLPWATKSFRKASANVSTDMVAAGLRAEGRFAVTDNIALIPHAGVRFLTQSSGAYDTKVDGAKAFSTKAESSTTGQVPVGLAVRGDFDTAAGWSVKPWGDVSVMPQFGETQTRTTVTAHGVGIPESMTGDMTGHFAASGSLGVIAEKGAFSAAASTDTPEALTAGATMPPASP